MRQKRTGSEGDLAAARPAAREDARTSEAEGRLNAEYRSLADNIPYLVARFDRDLRHLYVNRMAAKAGVLTPEGYLGKTIGETGVEAALAELWEGRLREVLRTGKTLEVEQEFPTPEGGRVFHTTLVPERAEDGSILSVLSFANDVTVNRRAEKELFESEQRLRFITENCSEYIWLMDLDYHATWISPSMARDTGYSLDELAELALPELVTPGSRESWLRLVVIASRSEGSDSSCRGVAGEDELELRKKDGSTCWLSVSFETLRNKDGQNSAYLCTGRDISARKLATVAMEQSEKRYRRLFEAAKDGILIIAADSGLIVDVNTFLLELTGYDEDEMLGKSLWEIGAFKDIGASKEAFLKLQAESYVRYDNLPLIGRDGRKIDVEFISNVYIVGDRREIQCNIRDITARKILEEEDRQRNVVLAGQQATTVTGILVLSSTNSVLSCNPRYLEIWGMSPTSIQGGSVGDCHRLMASRLSDSNIGPGRLDRLLKLSDESLTDEFEIDDGTTVECYSTPMHAPDKGVSGRVLYCRDVSEVKRLALSLTESERKYRRLFEAAEDGILILDAETGRITDVNPYLVKLTGYSQRDFLDRSIWEVGPFKDVVASKKSLLKLQTLGYVRYEDLPLSRIDGTTVEVEFVSNVYAVGAKNVIQCNIRDISERIRSAKELEFRNLILATQQETALDGILVIDTAGRIISSNRKFAEMWGIDTALLEIGSDNMVLDYVLSMLENPDEFRCRVEFLYANPSLKSDDEIRLKDGRIFERYSAGMLDAQGEVFGRVWYFRDISARKEAESTRLELEAQLRGRQKMEAIGSLAGGIAHDFNNLLSVILSYAGFALKACEEGSPLREDLMEIRDAGERAAALTRQLLAFSRKQILQPVAIDLNGIILGLEKMLKRILGEDIELRLDLEEGIVKILADPSQIEQVIMNLVVNSRDAMPEGGRLTIETRRVTVGGERRSPLEQPDLGTYALLSIADTGHGMDDATKAQLFEPFFTTKGIGKGTGLGLSTVFGIVKQSNGNIYVRSEPGRGTAFAIYLPLMDLEAGPGREPPPPSRGGSPRARSSL